MYEVKSLKKTDALYPKKLNELDKSPDIIYYIGDISICDSPVVAVIGKRNSSMRNLQIAEVISRRLSQNNYVVLNGLALGCDASAVKGAVLAKGKVIAIMPCGLDNFYPAQNKALAEAILENGGCIISEYECGVKPEKYRFVERDRIQAALSSKIIVIDADKDGGTMHTVKFSQKLKRPIGCVMENENASSGNKFLIESRSASKITNNDTMDEFLNTSECYQLELDFEENKT